jgi:hypothetical protein
MSSNKAKISGKLDLRRSKYFFDHSKVRSTANERQDATSFQNSPFRLKHLICGRFASLRMVTEKIFNSRSEHVSLVFRNLKHLEIMVLFPRLALHRAGQNSPDEVWLQGGKDDEG